MNDVFNFDKSNFNGFFLDELINDVKITDNEFLFIAAIVKSGVSIRVENIFDIINVKCKVKITSNHDLFFYAKNRKFTVSSFELLDNEKIRFHNLSASDISKPVSVFLSSLTHVTASQTAVLDF